MHLSKLPGTSGLFFVAVLRVGGFGNGFAVRNAGFDKRHTHALGLFHPVFDQVEVQLTLAVQERLFERCAQFHTCCKIFLMNGVQGLHEFFHVIFIGLLNGNGYPWFGERNGHNLVIGPFAIERIVGMGIFKFDSHSNVSRFQFSDRDPIFAIGDKELAKTFDGAIREIGEFIPRFEYAATDLEVRQ